MFSYIYNGDENQNKYQGYSEWDLKNPLRFVYVHGAVIEDQSIKSILQKLSEISLLYQYLIDFYIKIANKCNFMHNSESSHKFARILLLSLLNVMNSSSYVESRNSLIEASLGVAN